MKSSPPRPTGGLTTGALPQPGTRPERPDRRVDDQGQKQEWAILISKFAAKPGSLVFEPAGQFTRCVFAYTEAEAFSAMMAVYRPQATAANGPRFSYTVSSAGGGGCGQSGGGGSEASSDTGNAGSSGGGGAFDGGSTEGSGAAGPLEPFADPLDIDFNYEDEFSGESEIDEFDLEAIPTSVDYDTEPLENEFEPAEVSAE